MQSDLPLTIPVDFDPFADTDILPVTESRERGEELSAAENNAAWGGPDLPLDRKRPARRSWQGARKELRLDEPLCRALEALAARHGCGRFVLLLAAFQVLLARLSTQDDFAVGIALANLPDIDKPRWAGRCAITVPLRCRVEPEDGFAGHLARVRQSLDDAAARCRTTFDRGTGSQAADQAAAPLPAVVFNIEAAGAPVELGGRELEALESGPGRLANADLALNGWDDGHGIRLQCDYSTELFAPATIERWLGHYRVLLDALAAGDAACVGRLPLLTEAERRQAISGWNARRSYPKGPCLHERFERQAARSPGAVALVCEEHSLTYEDLNKRANRLAHRLRKMGVAPDQLVGLRVERGIGMVVGMLAILKAGGGYLPLDPAYPRERIAFMLEDSRVGVVVTERALLEELDGIGVAPALVDEDPDEADSDPPPAATADHLAYAIYTSGSTGKPKGVLITHHNVARLFDATEPWYRFDERDVWTLFHSYAFDFSVWELWGALLYGGRVVVVPYGISRSPEAFRDLLVRERVTVLNQTPSAFRQLMQADLARPKAEFALRYVIFGGEALELQSLRGWFERYGDAEPRLVNMYGITETTVHVTYRPIHRADVESEQGSVIGVPIPDLQLCILDRYGAPAPIGVPGEIHVGGAGVARGYLNRPQLTSERFVPDPFGDDPHAKLYRSGDLARRLENGDIEYLGRIDTQVKIRGFRIETAEIEAAILKERHVRQAAVVAREDASGDKRLVAYVVAEDQDAELVSRLWSRLRASLPEYMLPAHFVRLPSLPLTHNGKLDRKALPRPSRSRPNLLQAYVAPRTPLERHIAGLWCEILDIETVGADDRFFELGGDSLRAARFINRLRARLDEPIFITTIFDAPTVAQYAAMLERDYADAVRRAFGGPHPGDETSRRDGGIDAFELAAFRRCVPSRPLLPPSAHPRNGAALFVLGPPRSGTTLLRVMLAGHPALFAAPELQLLGFETLEERREAYRDRHALWREGGIRALMELHACSAEDAKGLMDQLERGGMRTADFYRYLQEAAGGRMLVDKSPSYALDPNALARAERDFTGALYVHLIRHPYAMVTSFEKERMGQVLHLGAHDFTPRQLGELIWLTSHMNIREFLRDVPQRRQYAIRYEELVVQPRAVMQAMCERLGIPFDEGLLRPYENLDRKMADGLQPDSMPMGDTHLFRRRSIDPSAAARWRGVAEDNFLSEATWRIAEALGYERPDGTHREPAAATGVGA